MGPSVDRHKKDIADRITRGGWSEVDGERQGFLNCVQEGNTVYGYFAQEGELVVEQYDDQQQPQEQQQRSFERILFLILLDEGVLIAQSIRISRYFDLTGPTVRKSLFDALEMTFRSAGLVFQGSASFEPFKLEYSKEQLVEIFERNSIQRVVIGDLLNRNVPESLMLFNPDFDADAFLKAVIDEDLGHSEEVEWEGSNIQETKIATGLLHAGSPQLIEGYDENRVLRQWRPAAPEKIALELNTDAHYLPQDDLRRLIDYVQRVFGSFSDRLVVLRRQQDTSDLPIFRGHQDS